MEIRSRPQEHDALPLDDESIASSATPTPAQLLQCYCALCVQYPPPLDRYAFDPYAALAR
jgi:hypothetical protein